MLYERYSSLLDQSKALINLLERTNYWDRICILAGLAFFLLTCGWIFKRRVVDKAVGGLASVVWGLGRIGGGYKVAQGLELGLKEVSKAEGSVNAGLKDALAEVASQEEELTRPVSESGSVEDRARDEL